MDDKRNYCVYVHVNKQNGKLYIGRTGDIKQRWKPHSYNGCKKFYEAISKYGWDGFEHIILLDGLTYEQSYIIEKELILKYNTTNDEFGYNISPGTDSINHNKTLSMVNEELLGESDYLFVNINKYMLANISAQLTTKENSVMFKLIPYIYGENGVLYYNDILTIKDLSILLHEEYNGFRKTIRSLEQKNVLKKNQNYL